MLRRKKVQQRIRKKLRRKVAKKKSNWRLAIAKTYHRTNDGERGKRLSGRGKRSRKERCEGGDGNSSVGCEGEVQSDIDEEEQERLNERDPLETQLFLKGLPLDTSEDELMRFFESRFGRVSRVLLVRNRSTKMLAGTCFVHCGSVDMAEKIFEHAQLNARELSSSDRTEFLDKTKDMSHCQAKRLRFKMRADAFMAREPFMTLRETRFTVHRVLSRKDSQETTAALQKKKKRTKVAADDPRPPVFVQEGLILPDTPAARGLHPRYLGMIQLDYEARKNQLRDSNMFVSTTRLSVRNLPRTVDERELRTLFSSHVRVFLKKHKEWVEKDKWGKFGPIKNVKIVRDSAGTSKGYAFIEFINHPIALHALRAVNNNPTIFGDHRRPMVSFAIEDINALQKLQRLRELRRQRDASRKDGGHQRDK
uniref:Putative RNA-binding protein n=1 Tax=Trypanosoma vivax (strain Y486) TaxID=1055687 RepID=G0U9B6_TRYVY|nr:putative RNA-binding protein [Trypanosoma vivax Y486]